jgi:hypothetical protein
MNKMLMSQLARSSFVNITQASTPMHYVEDYPQEEVEEEEEEYQPIQDLDSSPIREPLELEEVLDPVPHTSSRAINSGAQAKGDSSNRTIRSYPTASSVRHDRASLDNDEMDQDEDLIRDRRVSDIFCEERIAPILKTSAEIGGLECMEEETKRRPNSRLL